MMLIYAWKNRLWYRTHAHNYLSLFPSERKKWNAGAGKKSDPFSTECDDLLKFVYADKKKATHFA